jgi:hypothetical protein
LTYKIGITAVMGIYLGLVACNQNTNHDSKAGVDSIKMESKSLLDTSEDCAKPTKYPNQDKPMALMMRQMADDAQKMKDKVEAGEQIDANEFPLIRFHLVEPTDPDVLQPQFYENARLFQQAHKAMMSVPANKQKEMYTAYINQCINCHQTYCSGPLKRIRKLVLN